MSHQLLIDGERVDALVQIFGYLKISKGRHGMMNLSAKDIPNAVMAPFLRALMRREARLLGEDANRIGEEGREPRTPDQRRADAFIDLITSLDAAAKYRPSKRFGGGHVSHEL